MGIAKGGLIPFQVSQNRFGGIIFPQVTSQQCIDETALRVQAAIPGQLNSFMHSSMSWDAFQPKNLVESKAQQALQSLFSRRLFCFPRNKPIQRQLPANYAIDQFRSEERRVGKEC